MKTTLDGVAGGVLPVVMLFTFRAIGFGWNGDEILLNPTVQSPKLIAVWTELDPVPLIGGRPGHHCRDDRVWNTARGRIAVDRRGLAGWVVPGALRMTVLCVVHTVVCFLGIFTAV